MSPDGSVSRAPPVAEGSFPSSTVLVNSILLRQSADASVCDGHGFHFNFGVAVSASDPCRCWPPYRGSDCADWQASSTAAGAPQTPPPAAALSTAVSDVPTTGVISSSSSGSMSTTSSDTPRLGIGVPELPGPPPDNRGAVAENDGDHGVVAWFGKCVGSESISKCKLPLR